jgi:hypothetical protein
MCGGAQDVSVSDLVKRTRGRRDLIMRFIPTLLHGAADYLVGLTVIGLRFYQGWVGSQRASFVVLGTFVIIYSLFTD